MTDEEKKEQKIMLLKASLQKIKELLHEALSIAEDEVYPHKGDV